MWRKSYRAWNIPISARNSADLTLLVGIEFRMTNRVFTGVKIITKFSWDPFCSKWVTSMTSWLVYDVINENIIFCNSAVKSLNYRLNAFVVDLTWTQTNLRPINMTFDITSGPKVTSGWSKINETWTIWVSIDWKSSREYVLDCNKCLK